MHDEMTDWGKSVAVVVLHEGRVLLTRHTYGNGWGKLIIPGGYVERDENPLETAVRECQEETGVTVRPVGLLGVRFNAKDWYAVFLAEYVSGEPRSDQRENSEALWLDAREAIQREDVPDLTRKLLDSALSGPPLARLDYASATPGLLFAPRPLSNAFTAEEVSP